MQSSEMTFPRLSILTLLLWPFFFLSIRFFSQKEQTQKSSTSSNIIPSALLPPVHHHQHDIYKLKANMEQRALLGCSCVYFAKPQICYDRKRIRLQQLLKSKILAFARFIYTHSHSYIFCYTCNPKVLLQLIFGWEKSPYQAFRPKRCDMEIGCKKQRVRLEATKASFLFYMSDRNNERYSLKQTRVKIWWDFQAF